MEDNVLLKITYEGDDYGIHIGGGVNLAEVAFAIACVARVLSRDGYFVNANEFVSLVSKYANDPQFNELQSVRKKDEVQ